MTRIYSLQMLLDELARRGVTNVTASEAPDRHILTASGINVYVANGERGDWLYGTVGSGHHHSDDNVLYAHFADCVASLLKGEKACQSC